ncbi:RagB/SusD family nutrient uptake outer membrane protein [Pedobacter sp. PAMC26386]|nr:RagB/SusD family nutrient uptake outer membrane protein [Pedobacter sp. PAMC26386]
MKLFKILIPILVLSTLLCSCKKYLDLKPDRSLYVPSNLTDCQALLDDYTKMNSGYPADGEVASDHYYLTDASWTSLSNKDNRDNYIWTIQANHSVTSWAQPYATIFNSNLVLQVLDGITPKSDIEYNTIKGSALFFRGFALHSIASLFCKPYDAIASANDPGVPTRLSPDINIVYGRGTVQQTYNQIIQDLKMSVDLLPATSTIKSRPNKAAAYAELARVYLSMRDYTNAGTYADLCLKINSLLLNYSSLNATATIPFTRFNDEVIFSSTLTSPNFPPLSQTNAKIVSTLYSSYQSNDIRKQIFFKTNTGPNLGTFAFKGSYDGSSTILFGGLATDEMYLIRSECFARAGKTTEALNDLNNLLKTRWKITLVNGVNTTPYPNYTASSADEALGIILKEREKELIFRGIRWTDLRRLNKESRFAITLARTINGIIYSLPPDDSRYTLLIPQNVINNTGVPQNDR